MRHLSNAPPLYDQQSTKPLQNKMLNEFNRTIDRWNPVSDVIQGQRPAKRRRKMHSTPVELPELVCMITSNLGLKDRMRAEQVNSTWRANTRFSGEEYVKIFMDAMQNGNTPLSLRIK